MNNRVFWGAIALAVAGIFAAASIGDAARRLPNRDGTLIAGHDGVDQQMIMVDDNGNISVEFGANGTAFTVAGAAADDAAASGNPVPIGCMFETTVDAVDNNDIARVNCSASGELYTIPGTTNSAISSTTITRPANTTQYTANDAWANATSGATYSTFSAACRRADGHVLIPQIDIHVDEAPATKLQGILWLFHTVPSDAIEDADPFTLPAADYANLTGNMQGFPFTVTAVQAGTNTHSGISLTGTTYRAKCASGATAIYGMVQVVNAYTPTSGEVMTITLHTIAAN